jgi:hypothetical protein
MSAVEDPGGDLTSTELRELRRLAGFMVPASTEYAVPGADDAAIFADIVRSLGRDRHAVRQALALLRKIAGGDFAGLDEAKAEAAATALLARDGSTITALGRRAAMLLPRRPCHALSRSRAAAALSERPCGGARRLVTARCGAQPAEDVARR